MLSLSILKSEHEIKNIWLNETCQLLMNNLNFSFDISNRIAQEFLTKHSAKTLHKYTPAVFITMFIDNLTQ